MSIELEIQGIPALRAVIERATKDVVLDLRSLFELLSSDFYKDEKRIFQLKSKGRYEDLADSTKDRKQQLYGFTYPILFATGRLARSLLDRDSPEAINVIKKDHMIIGTSVPYAVYHHSERPRSKIPRRPLWDESESGPLMKRWIRTTDRWLDKAVGDRLK